MSAWVRVITYSEFNHLIYTIRSSIRNQSHMPRSRTQQKQLTSSLVSAPLIPSDTCTLILTTSIFLSLIFSHPRLLPDRYRTEWSAFSLHIKEFLRVLETLDICVGNSTTHSVKRVTCPLIASSCIAIGMLINATIVIKFSVGGDWDLFGDQSREIWDKKLWERQTYSGPHCWIVPPCVRRKLWWPSCTSW